MGWATRCLRNLFCVGKEKECSNSSKEKERWDLDGSCNVGQIPAATEASWLGNYFSETEKEQSKHAIAAAAADAAVAAAQAAVAVVRLTSHRRGTMFGADQGWHAAVKIQTAFWGYLKSSSSSQGTGEVAGSCPRLSCEEEGCSNSSKHVSSYKSTGQCPNAEMKTAGFSRVIPLRDLMTQEVNTLHLFTAGGYRHLLKRPSTLLMRAQRHLKSTLAGPILDLGKPTPACVIAAKTAHSSKHSPLHCHSRCPQLISQHLAAEILVTSIGCLPGRNAGSTLPKVPYGFQILVACPSHLQRVCVERASSSSTPIFLITWKIRSLSGRKFGSIVPLSKGPCRVRRRGSCGTKWWSREHA